MRTAQPCGLFNAASNAWPIHAPSVVPTCNGASVREKQYGHRGWVGGLGGHLMQRRHTWQDNCDESLGGV
jgi:hypothetical protein